MSNAHQSLFPDTMYRDYLSTMLTSLKELTENERSPGPESQIVATAVFSQVVQTQNDMKISPGIQ